MERVTLLIIGAGPTGLGAALRCQEIGERDFLILEGAAEPGGLATSVVDEQGFTWDLGAHLQFSHYQKVDEILDAALPPQDWRWQQRSTWIWTNDRFVPYPFQQ